MSFNHGNPGATDPGEWFRPVNPNEHSYTPGYGFSPRPPFLVERRIIAGSSAAAAMCLLGFFFVGALLSPLSLTLLTRLFSWWRYPYAQELFQQLSLLIGTVGALLIPFALYAAFVGIPRCCSVPMRKTSAAMIAAAVLCALAASVVGSYATGVLESLLSAFEIHFISPEITLPNGYAALAVYLLNLLIVPAVFEEIAFRGVLMQSLRRFGDGFALISSSMLFALVHVVPIKMPNAFLMGLVIGYFVLFTGSLRVGMVIHFVNNTAMLLLSMLPRFGDRVTQLGILTTQFVFLVLGIVAVIVMMRRHSELFSLKPSRTVNTEGQKLRGFFITIPMAILLLAVGMQAAEYLL